MDRGGLRQRASTSGRGKKPHNEQKRVEGLTTWMDTNLERRDRRFDGSRVPPKA